MFKKIIHLGAVYYTAISAVLLIFSMMLDNGSAILAPERFLALLIYSFVMSIGTSLLASTLQKPLGRLLHAICYIGGFFCCVILPYSKGFTFAAIAVLLFSAAYILVCLLKALIQRKKGAHTAATAKSNSGKSTSSGKALDINPNSGIDKRKKSKETRPQTEYKSLFSNDKDGQK